MSLSKVIETARADLGYTESPPGSNMTKYWEAYDQRMQGQPWCVAFLWWCFNQAGERMAFFGGGKTASCGTLLRWYKEQRLTVPVSEVQVGDIVLLNFSGGQTTEHCGLVTNVKPGGWVKQMETIEGNTTPSNGSQSNGGMVCAKTRYGYQVVGVCRPQYKEELMDKPRDDISNHWAEARAKAQTAAPEMKKYLAIGKPAAGFQSGMNDADRAAWNSIGAKYAAGDQSWVNDTNEFRKEGNWSSYYDDNGKINGWLYDGSGYGGYSPVFGGRVGETGYREGNVFYAPDGSAYTMAADGTLTRSGDVTWAKYGEYIGPTAGYHPNGGSFWSTDENGNRRSYDYDTAPDDVLEREGFYRRGNAILPIDDQYRMDQAIRNGEMTLEQAAVARAMENMTPEQRESLGRRKTTQGTKDA